MIIAAEKQQELETNNIALSVKYFSHFFPFFPIHLFNSEQSVTSQTPVPLVLSLILQGISRVLSNSHNNKMDPNLRK